eukprot:Hpha_TRINITY_DN16326_c2_g8::TRINITY_DN16326_c2_g8_i1::g.60243::m.60243
MSNVSAARLLGISRQDRAKMDVWVTSKYRSAPSLEWSRMTDRNSPIPGLGMSPDVSRRPGLDAAAPRGHISTIDFRLARARDTAVAPPPSLGFEYSRSHDKNVDCLSVRPRSTRCTVIMGSPKTMPRVRPERHEATSRPQTQVGEEDAQGGQDKGKGRGGRKQEKERIHLTYDFDKTMDKVYDNVANGGRGKGIDLSRTPGRNQVLGKYNRAKESDTHPNYAASSKHRRCVGGDFSKGTTRRLLVRPASRSYDVNWDGVDRSVSGVKFDKMLVTGALDTTSADQYGDPHEVLRPLKSKWSGLTEKLRKWEDTSFGRVLASPPTAAAPRCQTGDVQSAIRGADASLDMARAEILNHRQERNRKRVERSELYRDDKYERLSGRDPAQSPGFRHAYSDTPPMSPAGASSLGPARAASAPMGQSSFGS